MDTENEQSLLNRKKKTLKSLFISRRIGEKKETKVEKVLEKLNETKKYLNLYWANKLSTKSKLYMLIVAYIVCLYLVFSM